MLTTVQQRIAVPQVSNTEIRKQQQIVVVSSDGLYVYRFSFQVVDQRRNYLGRDLTYVVHVCTTG